MTEFERKIKALFKRCEKLEDAVNGSTMELIYKEGDEEYKELLNTKGLVYLDKMDYYITNAEQCC